MGVQVGNGSIIHREKENQMVAIGNIKVGG